jgi:hypothetical protein
VDDTGKTVREVKVASEPEALLAVLKNPTYRFKRIGLEAGPLSQWLYSVLERHLASCRVYSNTASLPQRAGFTAASSSMPSLLCAVILPRYQAVEK